MAGNIAELFDIYQRANRYLDEGLIRVNPPEGKNIQIRRQWMAWFLRPLGQPQRHYGAVHVAGTSGKGSVCVMVAEILRAAGVRAGLHVSPYLQVSTEKLWVDGRYADARDFAEVAGWLEPLCETCRGPWTPLHGLASVAVCLEHFRRQKIDVAVMETGVGGRSDLTNVVNTSVAVVTGVGWDHIKTLGPTLEDIAWHKAGIVKPGCRAVVFDDGQSPARAAVARQARDVGAPLRVLTREDFRADVAENGRVRFDFDGTRLHLRGVALRMPGAFQAQNAALAAAAVEELDPDGDTITAGAVVQGLGRARMPGRLETVPAETTGTCPVLLDGAHNPDKLAAMLGAVASLSYRRLHVVYGSIGHRTPDDAIARLARQAETFVVTEPRVYQKHPRPAEEVRDVAQQTARRQVYLERGPHRAVEIAQNEAHPDDLVLVTGSLYLCGDVRGIWYPPERVVVQRTSWPGVGVP